MTDEEIQALQDELKAAKEELDSLKAEKDALINKLETKDTCLTELETAVSEKDSEIATIKQTVVDDNQKFEALNENLSQAVAAYKTLVVKANPGVIEELITGNTITEIDQSLENAKTLVSKVRGGIEQEIASVKVPAGAPQRTPPDLSALSPLEKIQYAIGGKK
jgi:chromosome segregation ATPase